MSKHTPGPWRYEPSTKTIRSEPTNYWLASMNSWDGAVDNEANAYLIAAAPDLLAALEAALPAVERLAETLHSPDAARKIAARLRVAITKAKGAA